ncbi:cohesin domain-containing protein [Oceanicoccus sagamiensis]|uniref:Cohesin domain-containing protein n=1 Tax=Oceanicoccus sagamiensis TaxID=716816 RepID=A0A1X9NKB4_9GAMM|nr:cohesin domain-containing protein [Oceanicoccus sagamiensis]ARN75297.1 hypothetical protein BST96_14950 [Oceanicoccus sagamiensis]
MKKISPAFKYLFVTVLLAYTTNSIAEGVISISPGKIKQQVGELFTIEVLSSEVAAMDGGAFGIRFNPNVVTVHSVEVNRDVWGFSSSNGVIDNQKGRVTDIAFSSYTPAGSAVIAVVTLQALKKGRSRLTLTPSRLSPFASEADVLDMQFQKGVVRVIPAKAGI